MLDRIIYRPFSPAAAAANVRKLAAVRHTGGAANTSESRFQSLEKRELRRLILSIFLKRGTIQANTASKRRLTAIRRPLDTRPTYGKGRLFFLYSAYGPDLFFLYSAYGPDLRF